MKQQKDSRAAAGTGAAIEAKSGTEKETEKGTMEEAYPCQQRLCLLLHGGTRESLDVAKELHVLQASELQGVKGTEESEA